MRAHNTHRNSSIYVPVSVAGQKTTMSSITASPSCACLGSSPWDLPPNIFYNNPIVSPDNNKNNSCRNVTFTRYPFQPKDDEIDQHKNSCVPLDFGVGCRDWWNDIYGGGNGCTEGWCSEKWCFVDPDNCSSSYYSASVANHDDDLYLSYSACGSLGSYDFTDRFQHLQNEVIHVAYPDGGGDDGAYLFVRPNGTVDGAIVRFVQNHFLIPLNLTVVVHNVSKESQERFLSPFTACVHDISLGKVDLCIGAFWRTAERLLLSRFTNAFAMDNNILVVVEQQDDEDQQTLSWDFILTPLNPFPLQ